VGAGASGGVSVETLEVVARRRRRRKPRGGYAEGADTPHKQQALRDYFRLWLEITKNIIDRNQWADRTVTVVDAYAGIGVKDSTKEGSPVILLDELERSGVRYRFFAIERDAATFSRLDESIRARFPNADGEVNVIHSEWQGMFREICRTVANSNGLGLVYLDPTGVLTMGDVELLEGAGRIDVAVNVATTNHKRVRKAATVTTKWDEAVLHRLLTPGVVAEKWVFNWYAKSGIGKAFGWLLAFGLPDKIKGEWKRRGYYSGKSVEGREIVLKSLMTKKEQGQMFLEDL